MFDILYFSVPLPPELQFLDNRVVEFLAGLFLWVLIALLSYWLLLRVVKLLTRRAETDIDDVILGILRKPLILTIVLFGLVNCLDRLHLPFQEATHKTLQATLILVLVYLVYRIVFKEMLFYYGREFAERGETAVADILLPFANRLVPVMVLLIGGLALLQSLGFNTGALAILIGGASFVLAHALQQWLANTLAGISLLIDTPFQLGDMVVLEDGTVSQIMKMGLRATQLYVMEDHSILHIPNSAMASQRLKNLTAPTPDLRRSIAVGVNLDSDPRKVRSLLLGVAHANPYVLGPYEEKILAMKKRLAEISEMTRRAEPGCGFYDQERAELEWGVKKVKRDQMLDEALRAVVEEVLALAQSVGGLEEGGLDQAERARISDRFSSIERASDKLREEMKARTAHMVEDPNIFDGEHADIRRNTETILAAYGRRIGRLGKTLRDPSGAEEQRLDTLLAEFAMWIQERLHSPYEAWKEPEVDFVEHGDSALVFRFEFFVDSIQLEHLEREGRVVSDVTRNAFEVLRDNGIETPFPQQGV